MRSLFTLMAIVVMALLTIFATTGQGGLMRVKKASGDGTLIKERSVDSKLAKKRYLAALIQSAQAELDSLSSIANRNIGRKDGMSKKESR